MERANGCTCLNSLFMMVSSANMSTWRVTGFLGMGYQGGGRRAGFLAALRLVFFRTRLSVRGCGRRP